MKILTLTYEYPPLGGGGGKVADGLARTMTKQGHEVDVITMGFKNLPRLETESGPKVYRLPSLRSRTESCHITEMVPHVLCAILKARRMGRERHYDLLHAHFLFPDGFAASILARLMKIPLLATAHGSDVPGYNPDRFQMQHRLLRPVWRYTVAGIDCVVSPSRHLESLIHKSAPSARTEVIPNGYDPKRFSPNAIKQPRILVVTRMFQRKGVQYVLRAAAKLDLNVEVNVVGDGPYLGRLKQLASELNLSVKFWGWVDNESEELKTLYETSSIFAFTSDQENFPVNLLEAMCAGNAIITTTTTGSGEVVGDCAIQVPPQDPDAIASAFKKLLQEPDYRQELGRRARTRLVSEFSWDSVAARYEETMEDLVSHRRTVRA